MLGRDSVLGNSVTPHHAYSVEARIITLSGSSPPADQIHDQIFGLVASGLLAADERLPSGRQLAKDLGVAPGTVAKSYRT